MTGLSQLRNRPGTALRRGYLANSIFLNGVLRVVDFVTAPIGKRSADEYPKADPRRILLAVGGHLGDSVISTAILASIRQALPEAEIGMLVGSWARAPLEGHPEVARIHVWDHWKTNRTINGRFGRLWRHLSSRARVLREIKNVGYDVAIDLNPYFPNAIPLLWRAGIPVRVGYPTGGFGPLLTHPVAWSDRRQHRVDYHIELLRAAGIAESGHPRRYSIQPGIQGTRKVPAAIANRPYLVMHMGAGLSLKEWPIDKWRGLAGALLAKGHSLVFTGKGPSEAEMAEAAIQNRSGCLNLCDRIGWDEFVGTVSGARAVVCIDSAAGHVAAATGTPVVVLISGMNRIEHWVPLGENVIPLSTPVPCAPCFQSAGCAQMTCIREIPVATVLSALASFSGLGSQAESSTGNPVPAPGSLAGSRGEESS